MSLATPIEGEAGDALPAIMLPPPAILCVVLGLSALLWVALIAGLVEVFR